MSLFRNRKGALQPLKEKRIDLEKDIQALTEKNLKEVFDFEFVTTEFQLKGLRIDTLAFDHEARSFVILEYKRDKSFSVVDQGFAYLSLMLNNKAEFVLRYNESKEDTLKLGEVEWSQAKVVFLAASFTPYQLNAVNFRDLPIELWEVRAYEDLISYSRVKASETTESIKTVSKSQTVQNVSREIKTLTEEDHFKPGWDIGKEFYLELRDKLIELDSRLDINPRQNYIGFSLNGYNVVALRLRKSSIWVDLPRVQPKDLNDPEKRVEYRKNSYQNYNVHISEFQVKGPQDVGYAFMLAKQVYERFIG